MMLLIPIAFTSDHIETLFELDLEYIEEAKKVCRPSIESFYADEPEVGTYRCTKSGVVERFTSLYQSFGGYCRRSPSIGAIGFDSDEVAMSRLHKC